MKKLVYVPFTGCLGTKVDAVPFWGVTEIDQGLRLRGLRMRRAYKLIAKHRSEVAKYPPLAATVVTYTKHHQNKNFRHIFFQGTLYP